MAAVVVLVADRLQIGLGSSIKQGTSTVSVFVQLLASVMVKFLVRLTSELSPDADVNVTVCAEDNLGKFWINS